MTPEPRRSDRDRLSDMVDRSLITVPLLERINEAGAEGAEASEAAELVPVVIDLNFDFRGGIEAAAERVRELIAESITEGMRTDQGVDETKTMRGAQYVVARLEPEVIRSVAQKDRAAGQTSRTDRAIYRIWPDFAVSAHITSSVSTVKVAAARTTFGAWGDQIVWAVVDSGVSKHRHFATYDNLELEPPLAHFDFTGGNSPLTDEFGHGTHVAGILAGYAKGTKARPIKAARRVRDETGTATYEKIEVPEIFGMAPKCKIVSYKVLDANGDGQTSTIISALQEIARVNEGGRNLKIHGVNLSLGYPFDPEWFACGHSPLCNEVNRLVKQGVVVVVSAGNTGYGWNRDYATQKYGAAGIDLTINDPGNADNAITVGSTHRDSPHIYGVSFFSSKGPTGDGRRKPDLIAPGERILGPAAGKLLDKAEGGPWDYLEDSGTSMAAPHVSGAIAAFLSVQKQFIGSPDEVKKIFNRTAVDLHRVRDFQGNGLLDLHQALQGV